MENEVIINEIETGSLSSLPTDFPRKCLKPSSSSSVHFLMSQPNAQTEDNPDVITDAIYDFYEAIDE
jgi:hypothetical protein